VKGDGGGSEYGSLYLCMKTYEIMSRRWEEKMRGRDKGGELIKVHCMHAWNNHNETPLYNYIC
jgi:hypothetical protein